MRLVIDSLIGLMVLGVIAGVLVLRGQDKQAERELADTQAALELLHQQTAYQTTVQSALAGHQQVIVQIDPAWFGEDMPVNLLASADRPWIDLAPPGDLSSHPPDPLILDDQQASFWYNPTLDVFRARVAPQLSEAKTLELYNQVNGTALLAFEEAPDPSRRPMAHVPGQPPSRQYASLAGGWDDDAELEQPPAPAAPPAEVTFDPNAAPGTVHEAAEDESDDDSAASNDESLPLDPATQQPADDASARPTLRK